MKVYEKPNAEVIDFESENIMDGEINPPDFSGIDEGVGDL